MTSLLSSQRWRSQKRIGILLAIALAAAVLITLLAAPNTPTGQGSTYGRSPSGYGAWYTFMAERGTPVQRWQQPISNLIEASASTPTPERSEISAEEIPDQPLDPETSLPPATPVTLLRVNSILDVTALDPELQTWVESGNRLIILGVRTPVTAANFTTQQNSPVGTVQVQTKRRQSRLLDQETELLGDEFGAVVWAETLEQGQIIYANTPYLAANAYQDQPGNFDFLAQLMTEQNTTLLVDEYLHGYRDQEAIAQAVGTSWVDYFLRTPLVALVLQAGVILVVLVWAQNQQFGAPTPLTQPQIDNSQAYIEALAGILQKAKSSEFVLETVGREEQLQIQRALGLGSVPVEPDALLNAWVQQTGQPAHELEQVMRPYWQKQKLNEADLIRWVSKIQSVRRQVNLEESLSHPTR